LGMSLVLLLATGCVQEECIECIPGTVVVFSEMDDAKHVAHLSARLTDGQEYCADLYQNGVPVRGGAEVRSAGGHRDQRPLHDILR
jgi:hypothetical protein